MSQETQDTQKAISRIEESGHIGIFLPENPDFDALAACEVLLETLGNEGKIAGILNLTRLNLNSSLPRLASSPALPREFIISLHHTENPIAELRYEKLDDRVDIVVSPKEKTFRENLVSFREGKTRCNAALLLGIADVEDVANTPLLHPEFFTETPLISFSAKSGQKRYAEANIIKEGAPLCEIVYEFLIAWRERPIAPPQATLLLAGILAKTQNFRAEDTGADTLLAASELIRAGAKQKEARSLAEARHPFPLIQLFGRAAVRSKWDEEGGVLWSFLTAEDFEKTGRSPYDADAVAEHLGKTFPSHRIRFVLAQDPHQNTIAVVAGGERVLLDAIREKTPAEFQSPHLKFEKTFSAFKDAEDYCAELLIGVL